MNALRLATYSVELRDMTCGECGVPFAMPEHLHADRRAHGGLFYCPNGHARCYRESDVKRLERQLAEAQRTNTGLAERVRDAQTAKAKAEAERDRLSKRVRAGVCPCCKRSFTNLRRHMATKHAELAEGNKPS